MRIIPGNTKVRIEIFKGVGLWDLFIAAIGAIMLTLILVSTLPFKYVFAVVHLFIVALLLIRLDKEPNYLYLLHIIRHFAFSRRFARTDKDEVLFDIANRGENEVAFDEIFKEEEEPEEEEHIETAAERKERLKREKEEYKKDTKLLKSKTLTKEEEDAIWLKRAKQSEANKAKKKNSETSTVV